MKRKYLMVALLAGVLTLGGFTASMASSAVNFDLGPGSSIDTSATASGLLMWANVYNQVQNQAFTLSEGESNTFLFAKMGTNESSINRDDLVPQDVTAYVNFYLPNSDVSVSGVTVGTTASWNFYQGWQATWTPTTILMLDGTEFTVTLSDASFQSGLWLGPDGACGDAYANIYATVTLDKSPVPEPATMLLFGTGLIGLAGFRKKRKNTQAGPPRLAC